MTYAEFTDTWGAPLTQTELAGIRYGFRDVQPPDVSDCLALRAFMQEIADLAYNGRWPVEFSHQLFSLQQTGPGPVGLAYVTKPQVQRLRELWRNSGGWWDRVTKELPAVRFYPRDAWLVRAQEVSCR